MLFKSTPFLVDFFSVRVGHAWNQFDPHSPTGHDPPSTLTPFPEFSELIPDPEDGIASDLDSAELSQALATFCVILSPFVALLPSSVLEHWDALGPFDPIRQFTTISRALDDLAATARPIARDACLPLSHFLRLDRLVTLPRIKFSILRTPKVRIDFFPIPVFLVHDRWTPAEKVAEAEAAALAAHPISHRTKRRTIFHFRQIRKKDSSAAVLGRMCGCFLRRLKAPLKVVAVKGRVGLGKAQLLDECLRTMNLPVAVRETDPAPVESGGPTTLAKVQDSYILGPARDAKIDVFFEYEGRPGLDYSSVPRGTAGKGTQTEQEAQRANPAGERQVYRLSFADPWVARISLCNGRRGTAIEPTIALFCVNQRTGTKHST
jgi:hypothetical protein